MTDVKLLVIYPRPKDVDIFEKIYQDEHVPLAVAICRNQDTRLPARHRPFLPHCRSLFSVVPSSGGLRGV
jgi:hypothetical protein